MGGGEMARKQKLTPKQRRFVKEYLIDLNATKAAIRAGYSEKTASRIGSELLVKTCISNAIENAQLARSTRTEVTADRVVKELARIAFVDTRQIFAWGPGGVTLRPSDELSDDEAAIVAEVSETTSESGGNIKVKRFDKLKALELLGKHLGMYVDKREITGREGAPIELLDLSNRTTEELLAIVQAGEGNNS
jgi:phage terminase small subunit